MYERGGMKQTIIALLVAAISLTGVATANAQSTKVRPGKAVTMTQKQYKSLVNQMQRQLSQVVPERGERGEAGVAGAQGERGSTGAQGGRGERGLPGERGQAGEQGAKGDKGDKGDIGDAAIPSGAMLLFHGSCPDGWAANGWEHKWAVYNVKVDGRPWTSDGDQLTLTACIRN